MPDSPTFGLSHDHSDSEPDASKRYPSPMSTSASGNQTPVKRGRGRQRADKSDKGPEDGPPPAKKRKVAPSPKERTTEYLDLEKDESERSNDDKSNLGRLMAALHKKKKVVVVAGAGISVSAGIPDFRSATGLFAPAGSQQQKMKASGKHLFDASVYKHDHSTTSFHTMVREMAEMTDKAEPTLFHQMLASLASEGRLLRLYSQNIDCIDTKMEPLATNVPLNPRGPWPTTIQLHGGLEKMVCTKCGALEKFQGDLFVGAEAPLCEACKTTDEVRTAHAGKRSHGIGRLRPRFVLYNEYNPDEEAIGRVSSADLKSRPDAVIVVGTSLKVPGTRRLVKEMCQVTRGRRDGFTAFINLDSEPKGVEFKDCWDMVVKAKCDEVAKLAALVPIGSPEDYEVTDEEHLQRSLLRESQEFSVAIPSKPSTSTEPELAKSKQVEDTQAIPTPRPSPTLAAKKTKQSKISFAHAKEIKKEETAPKPQAKKGRKPLKTSQPKSNLVQAFKPVKKTIEKTSSKGVGKNAIKAEPVKMERQESIELPALRPDRRSSTDSFTYTPESTDTKQDASSSTRPSTPDQPERPVSRDTISPKSVPRRMEHLIDA